MISLEVGDAALEQQYRSTNEVAKWQYMTNNGQAESSAYFTLSGTSMAAPVVSAAAALLLQKDPALTPDTIKARLMVTADKWTDPSGKPDPCTYGAGYLNIQAALGSSVVASDYATSPALTQNSDGTVSIDHIIWGTHVIWGTFTDLHVIWGTNFLPSSDTVSDSHIIWGTTVWTDPLAANSASAATDLSGTAIQGED